MLSGQKASGRGEIGEQLKRLDQIERASQQKASPSDNLPETYCHDPLQPEWVSRPRSRFAPLDSPPMLFADHAAPRRKALCRMLLHPLDELRRAHQAGLHGDVSEVRGGDGLLVAICRRGETAEHGDDLDHDRRIPSLR
jgi:hypothetical protein